MKCASSEFLSSIVFLINNSLRRFSSEFPPRGGKLIHSSINSHRMQSKLKIGNRRITIISGLLFSFLPMPVYIGLAEFKMDHWSMQSNPTKELFALYSIRNTSLSGASVFHDEYFEVDFTLTTAYKCFEQ